MPDFLKIHHSAWGSRGALENQHLYLELAPKAAFVMFVHSDSNGPVTPLQAPQGWAGACSHLCRLCSFEPQKPKGFSALLRAWAEGHSPELWDGGLAGP